MEKRGGEGRGREKHRFIKEKRRGIKGTGPTPLRAGRKSFKEFTVMTQKGGGERNERIEREAGNKARRRNETRRRRSKYKDIGIARQREKQGMEKEERAFDFPQDWKNIFTLLRPSSSPPPSLFFSGPVPPVSLRYRLFRLHIPKFHNPQRLSRVSLFSPLPSLFSSPIIPRLFLPPFPLSPFPSRPTCIGKYESFVPSALSGTCICHGHTQAKPVRTVGNAHACACVRACDCLLAGGDKDRSWRVGARDEKNRSERAREGEGGREREAEETEASLHQGVEDGQNGRVVRPNDDIPRLRSKFSQLTSRITRPRETRIFRKATRFPLILPLLLPLPLPLLRHAQDDG